MLCCNTFASTLLATWSIGDKYTFNQAVQPPVSAIPSFLSPRDCVWPEQWTGSQTNIYSIASGYQVVSKSGSGRAPECLNGSCIYEASPPVQLKLATRTPRDFRPNRFRSCLDRPTNEAFSRKSFYMCVLRVPSCIYKETHIKLHNGTHRFRIILATVSWTCTHPKICTAHPSLIT